jgi:hypothetical protein
MMNIQTLKDGEMQRVPAQRNPEVPEQIGALCVHVRCNLAQMAQGQREMTDDELLFANTGCGGFAWLDDPAEDVY